MFLQSAGSRVKVSSGSMASRMSIAWLEYLKLEQCMDHGVWFDRGELDRALAGDTRPRWVFAPPPRKRAR